MQENRSFDHYFGSLRGVRGFGDPRPVTQNGRSVWRQSDGTKDILPFHPDADDLGLAFLQDLPHGWNDGHAAFAGGRYDTWVPAKSATTMAYLTRDDIPFHYALADAFTVCDAYHCSFIGSTDPSRYYMWTGYTGNDGNGRRPGPRQRREGLRLDDVPGTAGAGRGLLEDLPGHRRRPRRERQLGLDQRRLPRQLMEINSCSTSPRTATPSPATRCTTRPAPAPTPARAGLLRPARRTSRRTGCPRSPGSSPPRPSPSTPTGRPTTAPGTSPRCATLTANPAVWGKTALFITYDENDGFFDHVIPPYLAGLRRPGPVDGRPCAGPVQGRQQSCRRPLRARPAGAHAGRLPGARAATSAPRPSTTPPSSGSSSDASGSGSRTSRSGGAPYAAT